MDYIKVYNSIIEKSKKREKLEIYFEKHHILPKCLGGSNKKDNLVDLTYREHFLCHWLLCKIYPDNHKIKAAFARMLYSPKHQKRIISSWMYDAVKRNIKETHFYWLKNKTPWNKGKKGLQIAWNKGMKMGPVPEEIKIKTSETLKKYWQENEHPRKGNSPWNKGKKGLQIAWNKGKKMPKYSCKYCGKEASLLNLKKWHNENCKQKMPTGC